MKRERSSIGTPAAAIRLAKVWRASCGVIEVIRACAHALRARSRTSAGSIGPPLRVAKRSSEGHSGEPGVRGQVLLELADDRDVAGARVRFGWLWGLGVAGPAEAHADHARGEVDVDWAKRARLRDA